MAPTLTLNATFLRVTHLEAPDLGRAGESDDSCATCRGRMCRHVDRDVGSGTRARSMAASGLVSTHVVQQRAGANRRRLGEDRSQGRTAGGSIWRDHERRRDELKTAGCVLPSCQLNRVPCQNPANARPVSVRLPHWIILRHNDLFTVAFGSYSPAHALRPPPTHRPSLASRCPPRAAQSPPRCRTR